MDVWDFAPCIDSVSEIRGKFLTRGTCVRNSRTSTICCSPKLELIWWVSVFHMVKNAFGIRLPFSTPLFTAIVLLIGAFLVGAWLFPNFHWGHVAAVLVLYMFAPLAVVALDARKQRGYSLSLQSGLFTVGISSFLLAVSAIQLRKWSEYFPKFSYERLDAGDGFHVDSAFHISIIQGILRTGYPTTGQHLDPIIAYHSLSHYADAAAIALLGIDPWGSYALLFFAKFMAILVALVYFAGQTFSGEKNDSLFFVLLFLAGSVLTATGHVVGSHGQWFPVLCLLLFGQWASNLFRTRRPGGLDLAVLSLIVVLLSFGKVSLGFSFAVFAGLILLFKDWRDYRTYLLGAFWALFFVVFGRTFSQEPGVNGISLLSESWGELWTVLAIVAVSLVLGGILSDRNLWLFAGSFGGLTVLLLFISVFFLTSPSDTFYFFFAALVVGSVFFPSYLAGNFSEPGAALWTEASPKQRKFGSILFLFSLLVAFGPVLAKAPVSAYRSGDAIAVDLVNSFAPASEIERLLDTNPQWNVLSWEKPSDRLSVSTRNDSYFETFRFKVKTLASHLDSRPLLWLSKEDFLWLGAASGADEDWSTPLLVTAITGEALLFGVPDSPNSLYGFAGYSSQHQQISRRDFEISDACSYARPVIQTVDIEKLSFEVICE